MPPCEARIRMLLLKLVFTSVVGVAVVAGDTSGTVNAPKTQDSDSLGCIDTDDRCAVWAKGGECTKNPMFMAPLCRQSCGTCTFELKDIPDGLWTLKSKESAKMGEPQIIPQNITRKDTVLKVIHDALNYVAMEVGSTDLCSNKYPYCAIWAADGECEKNFVFMQDKCAPVCQACTGITKRAKRATTIQTHESIPACIDSDDRCIFWARRGNCTSNEKAMLESCPWSCQFCGYRQGEAHVLHEYATFSKSKESGKMGIVQVTEDASNFGITKDQINKVIHDALEYMAKDASFYETCFNKNELCALWAADGQCHKNTAFMKEKCAPVCQLCPKLEIDGRCPLDPNARRAWRPNDQNHYFNALTTGHDATKLDIRVLSSPMSSNRGPWIITTDNVFLEDEIQRLIHIGEIECYKPSFEVPRVGNNKDGNEKMPDEEVVTMSTDDGALSCQYDCGHISSAERLVRRLSAILDIDDLNAEPLQLVRYETGRSFHQPRHDYISSELRRQQGPRILTVFIHLNDLDSGSGGETLFPTLRQTVKPKKGRVLVWVNVHNEDPEMADLRTRYQLQAVSNGTLYGAYVRFHLRDFKTPLRNGCR